VADEQLVDPHGCLAAIQERDRADERLARRRAVASTTAEHQQVHSHVRAGHLAHGAFGQADRSQQVADLGDLGPGGLAGGVEGEPGGQHHDVPSGAGQAQRFVDEEVVDGHARPVVDRVEELVVPEGHVSDGQVEPFVGVAGGGETLGSDGGRGVQGLGDAGGDRVDFDAHRLDCDAGGDGGQERAGADTRFEQLAAGEPEADGRLPHGGGHVEVGVVGVESGAGRGCPLRVV
jgi:hypothetical protein